MFSNGLFKYFATLPNIDFIYLKHFGNDNFANFRYWLDPLQLYLGLGYKIAIIMF